ncbi:hypothetical protein KAH37_01900, partial [bacterium]|nr:hypothetical protein [bacterium]
DADGDGTAETVKLEEKIYENGKIISWWSKRERPFCENRYNSNFIPYTPLELSSCADIETNGKIHYEEWTYDTDGFITKKIGKAEQVDPAALYEIVWNNTAAAGKLVDVTYTENDGDRWRWTFQELGTGWTDVVLESAIDIIPATFVSHYSYLVTTDAGVTTKSYRKYSSLDTASFMEWRELKLTANRRVMDEAVKNATGDLITVVVYDSTDLFREVNPLSKTYYADDGTTELQRIEYHSSGDPEKIFCQGMGCAYTAFGYDTSHFSLNGVVQEYWNEIAVYDAQGFIVSRTITAGEDKASAVVVKEYQYAYSIHHESLITKEFLHYPSCYRGVWLWDADGSQWIQPEASEYLVEHSYNKYGDVIAHKRTISYGEVEGHVLEELTANSNETPATYFCDYSSCNMLNEARECGDFRGERDTSSPCNYSETAWNYDAEDKLTGIVHTDRADKVMRETTVAWQTVDGTAVHEKFERFYAGNTVEKKTYNALGDIVENYFNDEEASYHKKPRPVEFYHMKYFYDDKNGLLKEEIYGQGEIIVNWFDYLNTYSSNIAEGQELLINAIKFDNIGSIVESYDYQYDEM